MGLGLWRWLMPLSLLHVGHSLLHGLQHLGFLCQNLLKCWWWRWVGIVVVVVLVGTTVASVSHLVIEKRFETEIDVAIRDSQLYASRYIDGDRNEMRQVRTHTWPRSTTPKLKSLQDLSIRVNPKMTEEVVHHAGL
jgi:hypothetical protein